MLNRFAAWSATDAVCLTSVAFQDEVSDGEVGLAGAYSAEDQEITVAIDALHPYDTLFHELCHAADAATSWSAHGPFDASQVPERSVYRTRRAREQEAFARACAVGPVDVARVSAWAMACGAPDELDPRDTYVARDVFPAAPKLPWSAGLGSRASWATGWDAPPQDGFDLLADVGEAEAGVALLYRSRGDDGDYRVLLADVATGETQRVASAALCEGVEGCRPHFVRSTRGVWVEAIGESGSRWWRLEEGLEPVDLPCQAPFGAAWLDEASLWRVGLVDDSLQVTACDLATGTVDEVPLPDPPLPGGSGRAWKTVADHDGLGLRSAGGFARRTADGWAVVEAPASSEIADLWFDLDGQWALIAPPDAPLAVGLAYRRESTSSWTVTEPACRSSMAAIERRLIKASGTLVVASMGSEGGRPTWHFDPVEVALE